MDIMTASLISLEPTAIMTGKNAGRTTTKILTARYADGTIAFRCGDCGYESGKYLSTLAHRNAHRTEPRKNAAGTNQTNPVDAAIKVLQDAAAGTLSTDERHTLQMRINGYKRKLDAERRRRKVAEAELNKIKRAFSALV